MRHIKSAFTAIALIGAASLASADEMADPGQLAFQQYCATCHGMMADGTGPMTEMITAAVPDLTGLSARNDGKFPMLEVIHIIDGRTGLRGHGGTMPVYGAVFDDEASDTGPYGGPIYTRGKILSVAYYLETLQK
jgi:mono/diheme cytochrome c family protein